MAFLMSNHDDFNIGQMFWKFALVIFFSDTRYNQLLMELLLRLLKKQFLKVLSCILVTTLQFFKCRLKPVSNENKLLHFHKSKNWETRKV